MADDGVVEEGRQRGLDLRLVQREWQRVADGREDLECGAVNLDAAGCLGLCDDCAGGGEHCFRQQALQRGQRPRRVEHNLDGSAHIAQHQEADAAQPPQCVEPAGHLDTLADVRGHFGRVNPLHGCTSCREI